MHSDTPTNEATCQHCTQPIAMHADSNAWTAHLLGTSATLQAVLLDL